MADDDGPDFWRRACAYLKANAAASVSALRVAADDAPVVRDLHNGLFVLYLVDAGSHHRYVQERHLPRTSTARDELHAAAIENLGAMARRGPLELLDFGATFGVRLDGNFEASLLLLDPLWERTLADRVERGFAAIVPARDVLMFCDSGSSDGVVQLEATLARLRGHSLDHPVSDRLFVRTAGRWEPQSSADS